MKKFLHRTPLAALVCLLILTMTVLPVFAATAIPKQENYIADDAKLLSEATVRNIAKNNETLWEANGTSIGVCTVDSIGDEPIGDFARRVYTEWKMVEGVLIVVAKEESNFYLVQSTGIEKNITNEDLELLRDEYMEEDFAAANIDRAVFGTATKLTNMLSQIKDPETLTAAEEESKSPAADEEPAQEEEKGTTVGGVIVGILKFILIAALILIALFIVLFVAALFNDDVAELMRKYVFQRGKSGNVNTDFYDERLYGTNDRIQQRGRQNAQQRNRSGQPQSYNRPRQGAVNPQRPAIASARQSNPYGNGSYGNGNAPYGNQPYRNQVSPQPRPNPNQAYNRPPQQAQRPVMYNADGTVRRTRPPQNQAQPRPRQHTQQPDDATRMFSLPGDYNN